MIGELRLYPAYKDSGYPWLGGVPTHWIVLPLKRIAWLKSGAGFPVQEQGERSSEIPFLRVSDMNRHGNDPWIEVVDSTVSRTTAARLGAHVFPEGTIIFPKVGGALLTNKRRRLRRPSCIDNNVMGCVVTGADVDYAFVVLKQLDLGRLAKPGPVPAIGEGDVGQIRIALAPRTEQAAIVRYLDHVDRRIRRYIRAKQRLIALLTEQKQAIIHEAVTRGLDPSVPLKPSGVEWLGDVPVHWEIAKLKQCLRAPLAYGVLKPDKYVGADAVRIIRILDISDGQIRQDQLDRISPDQDEEYARTRVCSGDVLLSVVGTIGRSAVVPLSLVGLNVSRALCRMQLREGVSPEFMRLYTLSRAFLHQADSIPAGTAQRVLNLGDLREFRMGLPPLPEQRQIVDALHLLTKNSDTAIAAAEKGVALLREYRTRLTADVVTGKLDVREAAASLPDEPDDSEAFDELEDQPDLVAATEDEELDLDPEDPEE